MRRDVAEALVADPATAGARVYAGNGLGTAEFLGAARARVILVSMRRRNPGEELGSRG